MCRLAQKNISQQTYCGWHLGFSRKDNAVQRCEVGCKLTANCEEGVAIEDIGLRSSHRQTVLQL